MTSGSVRLLGPVEIAQDGRAVSVGGPIPRLLVVQLVLADGRSVPDEQAIDAVWGQWPPDSVATALRVHISAVRRAVRPLGWLVERAHHGFALITGGVQVDTAELDAVEHELPDAAPESAYEAVERGLALWRGPSLADLRRLPLGERLAAAYDRRRDILLDRRLALLLTLGRAADALAPLHRMVREDPLNEARWALLAEALYRSGHPADALAAVTDARQALDREMGLLPGPRLRELQRRILHHDFDELPSIVRPSRTRTSAVPKALDAQAPERLVGRQSALETLIGLLEAAISRGASSVVRVHGESGVGKSAVAAQVAREADQRGLQVFYGWAERDAPRALGLLADPLADVVASVPRLRTSESGRALGRVLGWRAVDDTAEEVWRASEPGAARAQVIDAARRALTAQDLNSPVVLVLDDVQWADDLSLAVVRSIARFPLERPVLLLVVERSGATSVIAGRGVVEVELRGLTEADISTWADQPVGEWTGHLHTLTGGLPLLLEDLLRRVRAGADLTELTNAAGRHLLRDRSAGLTTRTANTLIVAAVLGASFRFDDLLSLSVGSDGATTHRERAEFDLVEDLDAAARAGVLAYDRSDPGLFRFAHDLVRTAALEDVTPLRRSRLHAEVLRLVTGLPAPVAVRHALAAGRFVEPAVLAAIGLRAAHELIDSFGFGQARAVLNETLASRPGEIDAGRRALLLTALARAEAALGDAASARTRLEEAHVAAAASDEPEVMANVVFAESLFGQQQAQEVATATRLRQLLEALPASAHETRFQVMSQLAFAHVNGGRLELAAAVIESARPLAARLGTAGAAAELVFIDYLRCLFAGEGARRAELVARAGRLVSVDSPPELLARFLGISVVQHLVDGEFSEADERAAELSALGQRTGNPYSEWIGLAARFSPPFLRGDLAAAHTAAQVAVSRGSQSEIFGAASAYAGQLFALGWVQGKLDALAQPAEAPGLEGPQLAWTAVRALGLALSAAPEAAGRELRRACELIPAFGAHWIGFVGLALAVEAASILRQLELLELAEPILRRRSSDHVILGTGALDLGPVDRYLGLVLTGLGRREEAIRALSAVYADPKSGRIWQLRAAYDLASLGAAPTGENLPRGTGQPWAWLLRRRARN